MCHFGWRQAKKLPYLLNLSLWVRFFKDSKQQIRVYFDMITNASYKVK